MGFFLVFTDNQWLKSVFFVLVLATSLHAATPLQVKVESRSGILMNAETGAVLYEKKGDLPAYTGSTTKVITALYALEMLEQRGVTFDEKVTASVEAMRIVDPSVRRAKGSVHPPYRLEFGGTHMKLQAGETISLRTLFHGMMLCSGNDAANVIAEYVSGSIPQFMEEMNGFVQKKGYTQTQLYTPHGLPHPEHKVSPHDMALLAREALGKPFFREVVKQVTYPREGTNKQAATTLMQFNALLKPGPFFYPKAIGMKTGFTDDSGFCLVSAAEDSQRKLIAVIFGGEKQQRYADTIALFEAGFQEPKVSRTLFSQGFDFFKCPVEGAKTPLQGILDRDVVLTFYPSEEPVVHPKIAWDTPRLPIERGQRVGNISIYSEKEEVLLIAPLFAALRVEPTLKHRLYLMSLTVKTTCTQHIPLLMGISGIGTLLLTFWCFHRPKTRRAKATPQD